MAEAYAAFGPESFTIGAAMFDDVRHGAQRAHVHGCAVDVKDARDAAH